MVPEKGCQIYSKADLPMKQKNKKSAPVNKLNDSVNSSKMQSHTVSRVEEKDIFQCINKKFETKSKQQKCQAASPTVFNNKNCQADESVYMCPKKPKKDMQLNEPAILIQHKKLKKQIVPQEDDKNCQFTKYNEPNKEQVKLECSDKKCQENENIDMWPVKP